MPLAGENSIACTFFDTIGDSNGRDKASLNQKPVFFGINFPKMSAVRNNRFVKKATAVGDFVQPLNSGGRFGKKLQVSPSRVHGKGIKKKIQSHHPKNSPA